MAPSIDGGRMRARRTLWSVMRTSRIPFFLLAAGIACSPQVPAPYFGPDASWVPPDATTHGGDAAATAAVEDQILLRNVRVVDARGGQPPQDVLLRDGRIAAMGRLDSPAGVPVLNLDGATLLPGLVDAHVHITMAPGAAWRDPPPEGVAARRAHHLRAYLAWGVTTILDPAALPEDAREVRALVAGGAPSPEVLFLGPVVSPADGYVTVVMPEFPGIGAVDEVAPLFDAYSDIAPIGVKVMVEDGFVRPVWPYLDEALQAAVREEADGRTLPRYIHANSRRNYRASLAFEPHAFAHGPIEPLRQRDLDEIASRGVWVMPTLSASAAASLRFVPSWVEDPRIVLTVPEDERRTAADPAVAIAADRVLLDIVMPRLPRFLKPVLLRMFVRERALDGRARRAMEANYAVHEAGVPLVLGSDSGNWPVLPWLLHGPTTHRELQLLADAGLSPLEVIRTATLEPARMLGLDDELGTVEVGKRADLIVVDGDPLLDIEALSTIRFTVRAGVVRTPAGWMAVDRTFQVAEADPAGSRGRDTIAHGADGTARNTPTELGPG